MSSITALMKFFLMDQQLSVIQVNTYVHGSLGRVQSNIRQVSGDKSCSDAIAFFLIIVVFRALVLLGSCALMWKTQRLSHNTLTAFILTSEVEELQDLRNFKCVCVYQKGSREPGTLEKAQLTVE